MSKLGHIFYTPTRAARAFLSRWERQLALALLRGQFERDGDSVIIAGMARARGTFFHKLLNEPEDALVASRNLLVDEGILKQLGVMYYTDTKIANWYLTLFSGSATPTNTLNAANFAATMNEITSATEGFSNATRPQWTPAAPAANVINNLAAKAQFNIVCATSIVVTGGALISDNARGGTTGTLSSASKFPSSRELFNGETFELGYQIALTN